MSELNVLPEEREDSGELFYDEPNMRGIMKCTILKMLVKKAGLDALLQLRMSGRRLHCARQ